MRALAGAALLALCWPALRTAAQQQMPPGFPAKLTDTPAALPAGCPAAMVSEVEQAAGLPVYRSLHREIAGLRLGHEASAELQYALGRPAKDDRAQHDAVRVMTGMDAAQSGYLCAAFVSAQDGGDAALDRVQREAMVPVYNRMALETWRLKNALMSAGGTASGGTDSAAVILEERRHTGDDLMKAVTRMESLAIDGASLRVTCVERTRLLGELAAFAKSGPRDEFTGAAGLMVDLLKTPYRCVR